MEADHKGRLFQNLWQLWNSAILAKFSGTLVPSLRSVAPELKRYALKKKLNKWKIPKTN